MTIVTTKKKIMIKRVDLYLSVIPLKLFFSISRLDFEWKQTNFDIDPKRHASILILI